MIMHESKKRFISIKFKLYSMFLVIISFYSVAIIFTMIVIIKNGMEPQMVKHAYTTITSTAVIFLILCLLIWSLFIKQVLLKPLLNLQILMARMENGEFAIRGKVLSNDEIGALMTALNNSAEKIRVMMERIYETAAVLNRSSDVLADVADSVAATSEEMSAKASLANAAVEEITSNIDSTAVASSETSQNINGIASAVQEMSTTINNLASAAEETSAGVGQVSSFVEQISGSINSVSRSTKEVSTSVSSVATAVMEITISLGEINSNCERSINITIDAEARTKETNEIIGKLNDLSRHIGKIVNVINDIADQTNMLALNAAIEAASAGDAGRGFAVVANEVKELARQTAISTVEIGQQIEAMQWNMSTAVKAVERITGVIEEITEITNTIAQAVTEQSSSVGDISSAVVGAAEKVDLITGEIEDIAQNSLAVASSAVEASKGVGEIARSTSELSVASTEVTRNTEKARCKVEEVACAAMEVAREAIEIYRSTSEINEASKETASGAMKTSVASKELAGVAKNLEGLVKDFINEKVKRLMRVLKEESVNSKVVIMDAREHKKILLDLMKRQTEFEAVWTNRMDGTFIFSEPPAGLSNAKERDWWRQASEGNEYVSKIYISVITQKPCMTLSMPIQDRFGRVIGVMGADVRL